MRGHRTHDQSRPDRAHHPGAGRRALSRDARLHTQRQFYEMTQAAKETLAKLDMLNNWLLAIYAREVRLSDLLIEAGLSATDIAKVRTDYLTPFIEAVLSYIQSTADGSGGMRGNDIMFRYFGLLDGKKQTLQAIANELGVSRDRIGQLVKQRLKWHRHPARRAKFSAELLQIAHRMLE